MPVSADDKAFVEHVVDLMQVLGPCRARAMFGGHGVYVDDLMVALLADKTVYLKVDDSNRADFEDAGMQPFTYYKNDKPYHMSYWQAPEECLEDIDAMREWGNKAVGAALRAAAQKNKKKNKKKK